MLLRNVSLLVCWQDISTIQLFLHHIIPIWILDMIMDEEHMKEMLLSGCNMACINL